MLSRLKFAIAPLVKEILDNLPDSIWTSSSTTFLDPAMGGGQFLVEIERRLREAGHSDENIATRVFGCEKNKLRVNYAKNNKKLVSTNLYVSDFLSRDWGTMKFDVIVGNPPYNDLDTSREGNQHRGQGDNLAKKFAAKSLTLCSQYMMLIMPYGHRTYSPNVATEYRKNGLHMITPCENYFPNIGTNPCVFWFDRSKHVDVVDDQYFRPEITIPEHNIGKIFRNQPGRLNRVDYEDKLTETGKYQIVVTTDIVKFTDDIKIVQDMKDNTVGNWRVVFNCTTSKQQLGKVIVISPNAILSKSVHCLVMPNELSANKMKEYLESDTVKSLLKQVKIVNACNSKKFLQYIPMPED